MTFLNMWTWCCKITSIKCTRAQQGETGCTHHKHKHRKKHQPWNNQFLILGYSTEVYSTVWLIEYLICIVILPWVWIGCMSEIVRMIPLGTSPYLVSFRRFCQVWGYCRRGLIVHFLLVCCKTISRFLASQRYLTSPQFQINWLFQTDF